MPVESDIATSVRKSDRKRRPSGARAYLAEGRALFRLLCDGAGAPIFNISRGLALRDRRTRKPVRDSFVQGGKWLPARDLLADGKTIERRKLDPFALAQHVAGSWDVAAAAPSWTSCFVLDIDRHLPWMDHVRTHEVGAATLQRDEVVRAVWRALGLGADKQPVMLQTPSGGYHLYFPLLRDTPAGLEGRWPNGAMRRHIEAALRTAGVPIAPGVLEIYPTNVPLRAPCGRGTVLVAPTRPDDPNALTLEPVAGTVRGEVDRGFDWHERPLEPQFYARRDIRGQVKAFLGRIEAGRRSLSSWLSAEPPKPLWDVKWGPFGARTGEEESNKFDGLQAEVRSPPVDIPTNSRSSPPKGGSAFAAPHLLYGADFRRRVISLSQNGLTQLGQRHDAALKLTYYWGAALQLPRDEVQRRLEAWLHRHPHVSALHRESPSRFVSETIREAMHYYDRHVAPCAGKFPKRQFDVAGEELSGPEEARFRAAVSANAWPAVRAVLRILRPFVGADGRVADPVALSHRILIEICGEGRIVQDGRRRRAHVVAIEELVRLGVLTLHRNYRVGHRVREYSVWYQFGSAQLPGETASGELLVAERTVSEGLLSVLASGLGPLRVLLEPRIADPDDDADPPVCTQPPPAPRVGPAWWRRMYGARVFTVGEFFGAAEGTMLPGPWAWQPVQPIEVRPARAPPRATGPPTQHAAPRPQARQLVLPLPRAMSEPRPGCGAW